MLFHKQNSKNDVEKRGRLTFSRRGAAFCSVLATSLLRARKHHRIQVMMGVLVILALVISTLNMYRLNQSAVAAGVDWPTYMGNIGRSGFNGAETVINRTSAPNLQLRWSIHAGAQITSQPVTANGLIYWGSFDGLEHATDPGTHLDQWATNLGQTISCYPVPVGVTSTSAVGTITINGQSTSVVFVGGGNAQFYALNALTGKVIWQTPLGKFKNAFIYGSPAIYQGSVYIGISSANDCPLVQGKLIQLNASTGAILNSFNTVPTGCFGGGVWGSPAIDQADGLVVFATGNANQSKCLQPEPFGQAVVALHATNLSLAGSWQVPFAFDTDFGTTPTVFQATINSTLRTLVGLANKNGYYYALDPNALGSGPLWQYHVAQAGTSPDNGKGTISSSSYDGTTLYVAGSKTTLGSLQCGGSVQALDPATGKRFWRVCLSSSVLGAVESVPGLVIVGAGPDLLVLNSSNGNILFDYHDANANANFWGSASIFNGVIYIGSWDTNFYAFA